MRGEVVVLSSRNAEAEWIGQFLNQISYRMRAHAVTSADQLLADHDFLQTNVRSFIIVDNPLQDLTEPLVKADASPVFWAVRRLDRKTLTRGLQLGVRGVLAPELDPLWLEFMFETVLLSWDRERRMREAAEKALQDLENRKRIERAKGVMMNRYSLSEEEAYKQIRSESMRTRKSLVEIAESILLFEKWEGSGRKGALQPDK